MIEDKTQRRPIIDPLLLALKSRRVIIALAALVVGALVTWIPALKSVQGELLALVITLALALIGGYSMEDAARAGREVKPVSTDDATRTLIKEAVISLVAELRAGDSPQSEDTR
jgi:hypothetical protein